MTNSHFRWESSGHLELEFLEQYSGSEWGYDDDDCFGEIDYTLFEDSEADKQLFSKPAVYVSDIQKVSTSLNTATTVNNTSSSFIDVTRSNSTQTNVSSSSLHLK